MAPSLSQKSSIGFRMLGTTPSLVMNFLIQTASFTASEAAIFSDTVVESGTVSCLELFLLIAPPFKQNTKPDWDQESLASLWKATSV